ncbi:hypothetical protein THRCLA_10137 [Thraustotheca clavata]|uniref:non-specific serine/threonine protein kinase n=1 Tax=Thraustotheca clavata TaxID=74557 RepID=A0A1V9YSD2_9STRA|nr:hypothetical protein THRCLA_10137 [Thraustotheca clavata]
MDKYLVLKPLTNAIYGGQILLGEKDISKNLCIRLLLLESNCVVEVDANNELTLNLYIIKASGHINICKLIDYSNNQTILFLVFEYYPNTELLTSLQKVKAFGKFQTKEFLNQIANAIHFLHQRNVAHRDISLENILLEKMNIQLQKKVYIAPKALKNQEYASISIDMWSLGVVLFTMHIGKYPFREANESDPRFTVYCRRG